MDKREWEVHINELPGLFQCAASLGLSHQWFRQACPYPPALPVIWLS